VRRKTPAQERGAEALFGPGYSPAGVISGVGDDALLGREE